MRYSAARLLLASTLSLCVAFAGGCRDEESDTSSGQATRVEEVIGPEGGTVAVTDAKSRLYGTKLVIPAGALAEKTTVFIAQTKPAPSVPAGFTVQGPIVQFGPEMVLSESIEITFPIEGLPTGEGTTLGACCWDFDKGRWKVVPPTRANDQEMVIHTNYLGLCRWGTMSLSELESEELNAWMEDRFDTWSDLQARVMEQLEPLAAAMESETLDQCSTQDDILNSFAALRDAAQARIAAYLTSVWNTCKMCNGNGACFNNCDASKLITGQPLEWLQVEAKLFVEETLIATFVPSGGRSRRAHLTDMATPSLAKMIVFIFYQEAIRDLGCDWRCILDHGDLGFYFDLLVGNVLSFSIFAIIYYQSISPCI